MTGLEQTAKNAEKELGVVFFAVNADYSITYRDSNGKPIPERSIEILKEPLVNVVLPVNRDEPVSVKGYSGRGNILLFNTGAETQRGKEHPASYAFRNQ